MVRTRVRIPCFCRFWHAEAFSEAAFTHDFKAHSKASLDAYYFKDSVKHVLKRLVKQISAITESLTAWLAFRQF